MAKNPPWTDDPIPKRILVVDDDQDTLDMICIMLRGQGYIVETAQTGQACLQKIVDHIPDVLILDIRMPNMNGVEVTKKLRAHPKTQSIPIIMLTALTEKKYMKAALFEWGVEFYVTKPFEEDDLLDKVHDAIRYHKT